MPGLRYRLPSGWSFAVNGGFFTSDDDWAIDATYSTSENGRLQYYDSQTRTIAVECIKSFRWQERFGLGPALRLGHSYSRQTLAEETLSANENPFA